jgi:hypothetical protein
MNSQVVGSTSTNQVILNALGRSLSPITSVVTGAAVAQNVPATIPPTRLKKTSTPKLFAKIQMSRQNTPTRNVILPAIFNLPIESEKYPMGGLPSACPKLKTAPITLPCCALNPIVLA